VSWPFLNVAGQLGLFGLTGYFCLVNLAYFAWLATFGCSSDNCTACYMAWPFLNVAGQLGLFGLASHFCLVNLAYLAIWPD